MAIYLDRLSPAGSSDLPGADGPPYAPCSVLLRMGFTCAPPVTRRAVVSYTALPPLLRSPAAVYFCCTFLGVASTRRYLASCPVKPGLSSSAAFRHRQLRPFVLLKTFTSLSYFFSFVHKKHESNGSDPTSRMFPFCLTLNNYTLKQLPPINSRRRELWGTCSLLTPRK